MADAGTPPTGIAAPDAVARRKLLARVHIASKAIAMVDDDYRALLQRVAGQRSAADCDNRQLAAVVAELERLGSPSARDRGAPRRRPAAASHPVALKARALWISLHQLGAIDDASERALERFAKRQLGVDRLHWANQAEGYRLIEALKAMADRHGWDQAVSARLSPAARLRVLKDRLVGAQLTTLASSGGAEAALFGGDRAAWSDRQLATAAARLGELLREKRAA